MFLSITPWFQLITHLLTQTLVHKFSDQFSLQKCAQSAKYEEWYNITVGMYEPINKASRRACSYTNNKWICYNEVVLLYAGSLRLLSLASRQQL